MNESMAYAMSEPCILVYGNIQKSSLSFSVQSKKELWWLGAFDVPKETHEVLAWVFDRIS